MDDTYTLNPEELQKVRGGLGTVQGLSPTRGCGCTPPLDPPGGGGTGGSGETPPP